jgi:hypothetical protein
MERQVQVVWPTGDRQSVAAAVGMLMLAAPFHPEKPRMQLIAGVLNPETQANMMGSLSNSVSDPAIRAAMLKRLMQLAPERTAQLVPYVPEASLTDADREQAMLSSTESVDVLAGRLGMTPSQVVVEALITRCLSEGRSDLAKQLIARLPADQQAAYRLDLALAEGDFATVASVAGDRTDLIPQITTPMLVNGRVVFHFATPSGLMPRPVFAVKSGGIPVGAERIHRLASVVTIDLPAGSSANIEIAMGDRTLFIGEVKP